VQPAGDRPAHLISCEIISEAGRSAISCHLRLSFWNGVLALRASGGTIEPAFDAVRVIHVCTVESPPPSCCRDLVEADDTHNPPGGLGEFPLIKSIFEQQGVHVRIVGERLRGSFIECRRSTVIFSKRRKVSTPLSAPVLKQLFIA